MEIPVSLCGGDKQEFKKGGPVALKLALFPVPAMRMHRGRAGNI